jgi:hypothetical protein
MSMPGNRRDLICETELWHVSSTHYRKSHFVCRKSAQLFLLTLNPPAAQTRQNMSVLYTTLNHARSDQNLFETLKSKLQEIQGQWQS